MNLPYCFSVHTDHEENTDVDLMHSVLSNVIFNPEQMREGSSLPNGPLKSVQRKCFYRLCFAYTLINKCYLNTCTPVLEIALIHLTGNLYSMTIQPSVMIQFLY